MKIIKVFNNNVLLADKNGHQLILVGKGIGFQQKSGMLVDRQKIEQVFAPTENKWFNLFNDLLNDVSPEYLELAAQIIQLAEKKLHVKFNEYLLISLMDHLHFAIIRCRQGIEIHNEILWEVKHYYPAEFQLGQEALGLVKQHFSVQLPEDEAGFIALKFVESNLDHPKDYDDTLRLTKIIADIIQIVQFQLQVILDPDSISYRRFLVHLRFLAERITDQDKHADQKDDDKFLFDHIKQKYPTAFAGTQKVVDFVLTSLHRQLSLNEQIYLTIHIQRILNDLTK
ncbi:BglG family transcription antiterminator LicT [Liquorilactobacillus sicerae]|uniref:BglG family transcription antiterminator LicT n=1 Tax=Liquorilactobacillus sicerae TaxID=1416943 RepID=UPI002480423A|nr:PRD domain-containing protein [Liquorilactobacillus sicerae]